MGKLKSGYVPKGKHRVSHGDNDNVLFMHYSKSNLLETRGYVATNSKRYNELVDEGEILEGIFYGQKVYIDLSGIKKWIGDNVIKEGGITKFINEEKITEEKVKVEKAMEEKISEEKIIKPEVKEETIGKPIDAMDFLKQFKQQQGESVDEFLADMDSKLPYKMVDTKKKLDGQKVYEITFKDSGKSIYGVQARKDGENIFIKVEVNDEGQMYKECYVDQYGEKIE